MSLSPKEISKLKKLISLAQELLSAVEPPAKDAKRAKTQSSSIRRRRTGKELAAFRKMLKAERKRGVRVEEIAQKHGVSTAYIYQFAG